MNKVNGYPNTLIKAVRYFSDLDRANDFFAAMRWPNGVECPICGSKTARYLPKYRRYQCGHAHPRRQFTVKTGTVMEDSPLGLDKWAVGFWMEANCKNSISSYEIHRALGITQKSAWFLLHRVRLAVKENSQQKLGGNGNAVEADETFIGGLAKNMHKVERERRIHGTGGSDKTIVMGLLERHTQKNKSKVRATVMENRKREQIEAVIHKNVEPGTAIYTDALKSYDNLSENFKHAFIDHAEKYVDGVVHTNGMENFWALFKRCIKGTHISIEPFHLLAYVDSEAFRFNNREHSDGERFVMALSGYAGKRLTYKALIGSALEARAENGNGNADGANPSN